MRRLGQSAFIRLRIQQLIPLTQAARRRPHVKRRVATTALTSVALLAASCSSSTTPAARESTSRSATPPAWGVSVAGAPACDPLGSAQCMLPFPSDYYTVPDSAMPSGRRVDFPDRSMPVNTQQQLMNPVSWERNDGFSPGSLILVHVPEIDPTTTGLPTSSNIAPSLAASAPVVLLDADTMHRLPYWAELDAQDTNPAEQALIVHPAANLPEGDRIIVALRNLKTAASATIPPSRIFAEILSNAPSPPTAGVAGRTLYSHIHSVLATLSSAGVSRSGLFLAWDFTVASSRNITGWAVHMRAQALAQIGNGVPHFRVTNVVDFSPSQNADIARQVIGTFDVPNYLNEPGAPPGSTLHFSSSAPNALPTPLPGGVLHAVFSCLLPRAADPSPASPGQTVKPARPVLYGRGLFSEATGVQDSHGVIETAQADDMALCSTNNLGLDAASELADAGVISNLSTFATIPDRLVQSILDYQLLGVLMTRPDGFAGAAAFRSAGGQGESILDDSKPLAYYGNSEGSLIGGAVTAVSAQIHRAVLGVPSMDYAILLTRSIDFAPFFSILDKAYPSKVTQQVIFDLMQMLWDRGETDGYAENLTHDFLPGAAPHRVLLQMVFGDQQVANVSTEIEARTLAASMHRPALANGRASGHPFFGIGTLGTSYQGPAALYIWDDPQIVPVPAADVAPTSGPDPHDWIPRAVPEAQSQLNTFLTTGVVGDVCGPGPCTTNLNIH